MLHCLFIEADDQRSLGGSCSRDLQTMRNLVNGSHFPVKQMRFLTVSPLLSVKTNPLSDYKNQFRLFADQVSKGDRCFLFVSGHGYQRASSDKMERDGKDEYIQAGGRIQILDNEFRVLIESLLAKGASRVVCLADTCHSGTMFDVDQIPKAKGDALSLSACSDAQLDSCDISDAAGFGGSLTVHVASIPLALRTLLTESREAIQTKMMDRLRPILKALNQTPELYSTF